MERVSSGVRFGCFLSGVASAVASRMLALQYNLSFLQSAGWGGRLLVTYVVDFVVGLPA